MFQFLGFLCHSVFLVRYKCVPEVFGLVFAFLCTFHTVNNNNSISIKAQFHIHTRAHAFTGTSITQVYAHTYKYACVHAGLGQGHRIRIFIVLLQVCKEICLNNIYYRFSQFHYYHSCTLPHYSSRTVCWLG